MDNTIRGAAPPIVIRPVAVPTVAQKPSVEIPAAVEPVTKPVDQEAVRIEALSQAANQYQFTPDPFVVSDRTFTIYKDATGQYIVRYRSLRDGRVTYIPEPNILPYQIQLAQRQPLIEIKA